MNDGKSANSRKKSKFYPLTEHFRGRNDSIFTLTFAEIEKILREPLCASAHKYKDYWSRRSDKCISYAWISNGYKIKTLNFEKKKVVFERTEDMGEAVEIPEVFRTKRIPSGAKAEMEVMFEYIKNKYGL
jgi:hypothetical protein